MKTSFHMMYSQKEVENRIRELAAQISSDYQNVTEDDPLLALCTLRGAVFFFTDLVRALSVPCEVDFLKVHSYTEGTRPVGAPVFDLGEDIVLKNRHVLIVEDIIDTGATMDAMLDLFRMKDPADIRICSLLDKPDRRLPKYQDTIHADYLGFKIPDQFVIGWGLDYDGKYRLLKDIMYLEFHKD
ncbi:MAG: hypoxanthine phosphoribosyltransferase [Oscillospiraceae bacterium]|nr:hypoxanthine phosphoribosyltransferase [Oscillospiraceae bacterium]